MSIPEEKIHNPGEISAREYTAIQASTEARKFFQDILDPLFASRVSEIRSLIFTLEDYQAAGERWPIVRSSPDLGMTYCIDFMPEFTGAGKNVTGGIWVVTAGDESRPGWKKTVLSLRDNLSLGETEIAQEILLAIDQFDEQAQTEDEPNGLVEIAKKHQQQRDLHRQAKRWGSVFGVLIPFMIQQESSSDFDAATKLVSMLGKAETLYDRMFPDLDNSGRRDPIILGQLLTGLSVMVGEDDAVSDRVINEIVRIKSLLEPHLDVLAGIGKQAYPAFPSHHMVDRDAIRLTLIRVVAPLQLAFSRFSFWQSGDDSSEIFGRMVVALVDVCTAKLEGMRAESNQKGQQYLKQALLGKTFQIAEAVYSELARAAYREVLGAPDKEKAKSLRKEYARAYMGVVLERTERKLDALIQSTREVMGRLQDVTEALAEVDNAIYGSAPA